MGKKKMQIRNRIKKKSGARGTDQNEALKSHGTEELLPVAVGNILGTGTAKWSANLHFTYVLKHILISFDIL